MRLTEIFYFLKKNPLNEDLTKFSHIDTFSLKECIKKDKKLRKSILEYRKEENIKNWEEDIFAQ